MVAARWRIRRMRTVEAGLLNSEVHNQETKIEGAGSNVHLTAAFRTLADESRSLALNFRYESRLHRIYDSALKNLRELQQNRPAQPDVPAQPADSEPSPAESSPTQDCETNPAPRECETNPDPRFLQSRGASASGPEPLVSIKIRNHHPHRRCSFPRAHRGYRFYLAARSRSAGRLSYNENLPQATSANDTL